MEIRNKSSALLPSWRSCHGQDQNLQSFTTFYSLPKYSSALWLR